MALLRMRFFIALTGSIAALLIAASTPSYARQPDILLIVFDDLGRDGVNIDGLSGNELNVHTPELNNLAQQGLVFDHAYSQPLCSISRGAMLTGRYPSRTGLIHLTERHSTTFLRGTERTIAEIARDAGYATSMVGKWHVAFEADQDPIAQGFDRFAGFLGGALYSYTEIQLQFDRGPEKRYPVEWATSALVDLVIAEHERLQGRPQFLYYAMAAPHTQQHPLPLYQRPPEHLIFPDEASRRYEYSDHATDLYRATVKAADTELGRLLRSIGVLDGSGVYRAESNTVVIITSDNGAPRAIHRENSPLFNRVKGTLYDGGVRMPCIILSPQTPEPRRVDRMVDLTDYLPTLADVMGVALEDPGHIDGRSFADLLGYPASTPPREFIYAERQPQGYAIARSNKYKLLAPIGQARLGDNEIGGRAWIEGLAQEAQPHYMFDMQSNDLEDPGFGLELFESADAGDACLSSLLRSMQRFLAESNPTYLDPLRDGLDPRFAAADAVFPVLDAVEVRSDLQPPDPASMSLGHNGAQNESRLLFRLPIDEINGRFKERTWRIDDIRFARLELVFERDQMNGQYRSEATGDVRLASIAHPWDPESISWSSVSQPGFAVAADYGRLFVAPIATEELAGWTSGQVVRFTTGPAFRDELIDVLHARRPSHGYVVFADRIDTDGDQSIRLPAGLEGCRLRITVGGEDADVHLDWWLDPRLPCALGSPEKR